MFRDYEIFFFLRDQFVRHYFDMDQLGDFVYHSFRIIVVNEDRTLDHLIIEVLIPYHKLSISKTKLLGKDI